jgi:hypothetical protein
MEFEIAVSILVALFIGFTLGYSWQELSRRLSADMHQPRARRAGAATGPDARF